MTTNPPISIFLTSLVLMLAQVLTFGQTTYTHFEGRQTHPIALSPDGTKLFALNTPDARVSVFEVSNASNPEPVLIAEIPVGLEPVSVAARTNNEIWVVNEVGDSVSIIDVSRRLVVATLRVPDEPADVVFAQGKAFVSCARNHLVRVFDATSRTELSSIPLNGAYPRALATDAAGTTVFVAFQLSGNHTTVLPASLAPNQPAPTNTALPAAPKTGLIVDASDSRITYSVLDNDVARINASTGAVVQYHSGLGTNLFDLAIRTGTEELWVTNTDALNLIRFEPSLRGHFVNNQVTRLTMPSGTVTKFDLNPGINYAVLPNPSAQSTALAQPTSILFENDGQHAWVAAFGSDRLAKISAATGAVASRIDLRTGDTSSRKMRGPRGLAWHSAQNRLFVLNKLSNTITTVSAHSGTILSEIPVGTFDPMPQAIKEGRGFLFDARLSGNGTMSCATCHLDADRDGMAWDLGDPGGTMLTVVGYNNSIHDVNPKNRTIHPMKGPMTTQTLRGFQAGQIFHWRGDKPTIQSFNSTFSNLMGGSQIPAADMDAMAAYLGTLVHHPNPNRKLDRTLPTTLAGGNPSNGRDLYNTHVKSHCATCHALPSGSDNNIDLNTIVGSTQPVKTPPLRTTYQRMEFSGGAGAVNFQGFGMLKDGTGYELPIVHFYDLENLATLQEYTDIKAFVMAFDSGTAPTVGFDLTFTAANTTNASLLSDLTTLEAQARLSGSSAACDLVVRGVIGGSTVHYLYNKTSQLYQSDVSGSPEQSRAALLANLGPNDALTFLGVLPNQGTRFSSDRNANGQLDRDQPLPNLTPTAVGGNVRLSWPVTSPGWVLEATTDLLSPWQPVLETRGSNVTDTFVENSINSGSKRFYRLRRAW